jgi:hypothetical protein
VKRFGKGYWMDADLTYLTSVDAILTLMCGVGAPIGVQ